MAFTSAGLMIGTAALTPPAYPLIDPNGFPFAYQPPLRFLGLADPPIHTLTNRGFCQLRSLGIKRSILRVFLDLTELTQAIEICTDEDGNYNLRT
jgi:hypothetical protein